MRPSTGYWHEMHMSTSDATVLIVDDRVANRRLLEALLAPEGYATLSAADGPEALALAAQHTPDVVLLDVRMPGMNGHAVARALKASDETRHIPIILISAEVDAAERQAGLDAGADDFLTKPIARAELWSRVRASLAR